MSDIGSAIQYAAKRLQIVSGADARNEAFILLSHVTGRQISSLRLNLDDPLSAPNLHSFEVLIDQRCDHQPISQIIGRRDFWKHSFIVSPDVLDPRPDTETLVEQAVQLGPFENILDLGTGSGCILLSLLSEFPNACGVGIDASKAALDVAQANAAAMNLENRIVFQLGDWCEGITQQFDLIVSNPPYITPDAMETLSPEVTKWEPRMALTPEGDGLDAYREISRGAYDVLTPNGQLLVEIGYDQAESVSNLFMQAGFVDIRCITDINSKDRVIAARRTN